MNDRDSNRVLPRSGWCAGLVAGVLAMASVAVGAQNLHTPGQIRYVQGRLLVQPKPGLTIRNLDKKLQAHGGRRVGQIPRIGVHIVALPPNADPRAVARRLRGDRHFRFAEVDQQLPPALTPNDPNYTSGWHLPGVAAPSAWDFSNGTGVVIAILDRGVDAAHPDLAASVLPGYNALDGGADTLDDRGHGTKVAGAAAMAGNNLVGGTGVAFKAKILPVRVSDSSGYAYFSTLANGLVWAADHGARVASLSFLNVCGSATIQSAANYLRGKNGVVTGSAGNTGAEEMLSPSDSITCVSATDSADTRPSWSSYGLYVDVAAPGVSIYTTTLGGGYGSASGTSFSAPITAGVYALMIAANPQATARQLDDALFAAAVDVGAAGPDPYYGHGRVDAARAVSNISKPAGSDVAAPAVSFTFPAAGATVGGLVPVDVKATDDVGVTRVDLYAGGSLVGSANAAPYGFSWDTSTLGEGEVSLEAKAYDAAGKVGSHVIAVRISNDAIAPSVAITNPKAGAVISEPTMVSVSATDDSRVAKISLSINGSEVALSYGSSLSYKWDPYKGAKGKGNRKQATGSYVLTATATDGGGNTSSATVSVSAK